MCCILAHKYKIGDGLERALKFPKHIHESNQSDIQFTMQLQDIAIFERFKNLKINVFEQSSEDKTFSPKYINKNYYEEQIEVLLFENHYCLLPTLHNFCRNDENYKQVCRRYLNTYGYQSKLEEHKLRCFEQELCNIS